MQRYRNAILDLARRVQVGAMEVEADRAVGEGKLVVGLVVTGD